MQKLDIEIGQAKVVYSPEYDGWMLPGKMLEPDYEKAKYACMVMSEYMQGVRPKGPRLHGVYRRSCH